VKVISKIIWKKDNKKSEKIEAEFSTPHPLGEAGRGL
jgi:hypothetical protein